MNCFAKFVESRDDRAIQSDFSDEKFSPFTLLAISGFDVQPSRAEVGFMINLMFELSDPSRVMLACRNTRENTEAFDQIAMPEFQRLDIEGQDAADEAWRTTPVYLIDHDKSPEFKNLLFTHWKTWYGNWLFSDCPKATKEARSVRDLLQENERQLARTRARLLTEGRFAALTFDDKLLDIFANCSLDFAKMIVKEMADKTNVPINLTKR